MKETTLCELGGYPMTMLRSLSVTAGLCMVPADPGRNRQAQNMVALLVLFHRDDEIHVLDGFGWD